MKQTQYPFFRIFFYFLLIPVLLVSCVPQSKIKYLQRKQEADTTSRFDNKNEQNYPLQSRDNLYIRVYSLDPSSSLVFNKQSPNTSNYNDYANDASIYLNSYAVDDDGFIEFPVLGKIMVRGKTVKEIHEFIQKNVVSDYLKEVAVIVKLVNFKVSVLGEVIRPGEYTFYQNQVNIFEALSLAGDMSEFANRGQVALIRKTKTGSEVFYLNLNEAQILQSPYYHLQPNDIIYVSPLGYKRWGLGSTFPWAIILASVSTTLLLINYFK